VLRSLLLVVLCVRCGAPEVRPGVGLDAGAVDGGAADAGVPRSTEVPRLSREPVLTAAGVIWDLAFLPDGSALFTVRSGQVRRLVLGETASTLVADANSAGNPLAGLFVEGQSGLMGLAVDPDFTNNRRIYVAMSHSAQGVKDNRVVRFRLTEAFALAERADVVTGISYKAVGTKDGNPGAHSGGRLRFGPDGFLYLTTGDNHSPVIPQSLEALGSKVLRFTTEGQPAPGNPQLGSKNLIWARGFRNPQGIAFHPPTGAVFISEHGPGNDDEVTRLSAGSNGGWNPVDSAGAYNGYNGARMTDTAAVPGAVAPVYVNADSQGMSACTFLRGRSWKAYENRLAVAFLAGAKILALDFDEALGAVVANDALPNVSERVRSVVMGPDEKLYVTTDSGLIFRIAAN
jgi:aldose sugar dehydrogenase